MVKTIWGKRTARRRKRKQGTALTFTAEELAVLNRVIAVGQAVLKVEHPVISRLKGAMTRLGG